MIINNLNKPAFQSQKQANSAQNKACTNSLSFKSLTRDTISFVGMSRGVVEDMSFKSVLEKQLVSEPNADFKVKLGKIKGVKRENVETASKRVSSLSRYLKEDMVGFIVPKYTQEGKQKGGYQWFERSLENLLKGCEKNLSPNKYKDTAKELFGILATHDNYWKSDAFVGYLSSLKSSDATTETIKAIKELQSSGKKPSFTGKDIKMFGIFSPMKAMDKLLNDGCAYSGEKMIFDDPSTKHPKIAPKNNASLEHVTPKSWGGPDDDSNYMVTSVEANSKRGNGTLIQYLKGE